MCVCVDVFVVCRVRVNAVNTYAFVRLLVTMVTIDFSLENYERKQQNVIRDSEEISLCYIGGAAQKCGFGKHLLLWNDKSGSVCLK